MSYDGYMGRGQRMAPDTHDFGGDFSVPSSPVDAAVSVAFMLGIATIVLIVLKKSGFRAMVAVGRG